MTWNNPTDVSTGTNLTSTLWNNLLGASGSLQYIYDNISQSRVVLRRSTNLTLSANVLADVSFDTIMTTFSNTQQNFPISTPVTNIPFPSAGMYAISFRYYNSVTTTVQIRFTVSNGVSSEMQAHMLSYTANEAVITSSLVFAESSSATVKVQVRSTLAATATAGAPGTDGSTGGNMILSIAKL